MSPNCRGMRPGWRCKTVPEWLPHFACRSGIERNPKGRQEDYAREWTTELIRKQLD
jgi:hypothetical protein